MGMTDAEIANGGVIIFAKNRSNHVSLNGLRRSLAAIDYLRDCLKLGSVRWKRVWKRHADPSALIYPHGLSRVTSLCKRSDQSKGRDGYPEPSDPVVRRWYRIAHCVLHIIFFSAIEMFLAKHFVLNWDRGSRMLSLFFFWL